MFAPTKSAKVSSAHLGLLAGLVLVPSNPDDVSVEKSGRATIEVNAPCSSPKIVVHKEAMGTIATPGAEAIRAVALPLSPNCLWD